MFCREKNPLVVVHDRNSGVYLLNLVTKERAHILDAEAKEWSDLHEVKEKPRSEVKGWKGAKVRSSSY